MGYGWNVDGGSSNIVLKLSIGVGVVASAAGLAYLYKKKMDNTPPKRWVRVGEITEVITYPIKSCAPIRLSKVQCKQMGPISGYLRDRVFMVTTTEGQFITGRAYPKLVHVQPKIDGTKMILSAPGMENLELNFTTLHSLKPIESPKIIVWQEVVNAVHCGEKAAKWFSKFLLDKDEGLLLVYYPGSLPTRDTRFRRPNGKRLTQGDSGCLHDLTSFMMINQGSMDDLNSRLDDTVEPLQFRPNFVVKGPAPYEEDQWLWVKIGDNTVFKNVKECTRCVFTNIDPVTATRNPSFQPLKTLEEYRKIIPGETPVLGIHLGIREQGEVSIGDSVYVGSH